MKALINRTQATILALFILSAALCSILWFASSRAAAAQDPQAGGESIWQEIDPATVDALRRAYQPAVAPERYRAYRLNDGALRSLLAAAPLESTEAAKEAKTEISLPLPDGKRARFRFVESPIMEPELAAQFPEVKTYQGFGIDLPTMTARFGRTSAGFHAIILTAQGAVYIYPLFRGDSETYASYFVQHEGAAIGVTCQVSSAEAKITGSGEERTREERSIGSARLANASIYANGATLRTFRLAVAATGEYTNAFGGMIANAMSNGIVPTINAVNAIYRNELSVSFTLVGNNSSIVFSNPATDPYTNGNASQLLDENQDTLDTTIGEDNYDVGHVFDRSTAGGLASIGVVCNDGDKAHGTSAQNSPTLPANFDLMVAHELGHQFGARHTFNSTTGSCGNGGQRNGGTAYEPGSGSTIMSYAGLCGADNLQPTANRYFHGRSLKAIVEYIDDCGDCAAAANNNNTAPAITLPDSGIYIIPAQTPFALTAAASDAEDINLTYCWEQDDLGSSGPANGDRGDNPLFRSWLPAVSPTRTFPRMVDLLAGTTSIGETLPTTTRQMRFMLTARDNHSTGGGYKQVFAWVNARGDRGPFTVTQPQAAMQALARSGLTVTWNVAGTDQWPILTTRVRILLSTDGGQTFPITLAGDTANDGSEMIIVPQANTNQARIKVEARDNIFFNISPAFTIIPAPEISITGGLSITRGGPATTSAVATVSDLRDAAASLVVSVTNLPLGVALSVANNNGTVSATATAQCNSQLGVFPVRLIVRNSATISVSTDFDLTIAVNPPPTLGSYSNTTVVAGRSTLVIPSSPPSDANNNLSAVTLWPTPLPGGGTLSVNRTTGIVTISTTGTTQRAAHRITLQATDSCGNAGFSSFDLTVIDSPPQISPNANFVRTTQGGSSVAPVAVATVSDTQDAPGALQVSASAPAGITVAVVNTQGTVTATASAACNVAPGVYNATLTVRDSASTTASAMLAVVVDPNLPPTLGQYNNTGVTVGGAVTVVPSAPLSDPNNAVTVIVSPTSLPGGGLLVVNPANGHITVNTVPNTVLGTYLVKVTARDVCGAAVARSFNLTVRSATCQIEQRIVFAADTGNHRIQRFDGFSWKVIGPGTQGSGLGEFDSPESVAASADGWRIYVADTGNRRIQWSVNGGATWAVFATGLVPQGLVLDRDGNLYVSDALDNRVIRYPGAIPGPSVTLASNGAGAGRVSNPHGLAIDCRMTLYIADTGNNRILAIRTADAVMVANTGTIVADAGAGLNPAQVSAPQGVGVDNGGQLYVADTGNDRLLVFANAPLPGAAQILCALGPQLGQVRDPEGVTIAMFAPGISSLIVSDTTNRRIQTRRLPAGAWTLLPAPAGGGPGVAAGQFHLPSQIR